MDSDKKEEKKDDKKEEKTEQSKKDPKTPEFIYAPLEILKIISIAQNMNGLRHKDYQRYQTYCTRKISKIRQTYKMQQGIGKKFIKHQLTELEFINSQQLLCLIFEVERYWACGMMIKQKNAQTYLETHRTHRRMKYKFLKAAKICENIVALCKAKMDRRTLLEAIAYSGFIQSQANIECDKFTEDCLIGLLKSNDIYNRLSINLDAIESLMYKDRTTMIDPFVRLCAYKLSKSEEDIKKMSEHAKISIESIVKESRELAVGVKQIREVKHFGKIIPIKSDELLIAYDKFEEALKNTIEANDIKDKQSKFMILSGQCEILTVAIRKEKEEEAKKSEGSASVFNNLLSYVQSKKLTQSLVIQKALFEIVIANLSKENEVERILFTLAKTKSKTVNEFLKLCANILKRVRQLKNIEKDNIDVTRYRDLDKEERLFDIYLKYSYVMSYCCMMKLQEAMCASDILLGNIRMNIAQETKSNSHSSSITALTTLEKQIQLLYHSIVAASIRKEYPQVNKVVDKTFVLAEAIEQYKKITHINKVEKEFIKSDGAFGEATEEDVINVMQRSMVPTNIEKAKICEPIPNLRSLPLNPLYMDMVNINYPELDKKAKEEKPKKGLFWRIFGKK